MKLWSHAAQLFGSGQKAADGAELQVNAPRPALDEAEIRLLIRFMSEIGAAMNGAEDATTFIRRSLERIGQAYGLRNIGIFLVPTFLLVRYGDDRSAFVDLSSRIPDMRLDQTAALYELVDEAERGRVEPAEGLRRLHEILQRPARFNAWTRVFAVTLISGGLTLLLKPGWEELGLSLVLALIVGLIREAAMRWPTVWPLAPAAAGIVAGSVTFLLIDHGLECRPLKVLTPPLAIFLPGAALTVALLELSNRDIVAGGSRLAYGTIRLFLLVFGLVVAAQWTGSVDTNASPSPITNARYLSLLGLTAFTCGIYLHFCAPRGSFRWLLLVVTAAWAGQGLGNAILGAYPGGFVGGAAMIAVARLIQGHSGAPPLIVSLTPAFWLLVPGAIGLEGLTKIAQESPESATGELVRMLVTMVAIALGILFGLIASGSRRSTEPYSLH